MLRLLLLLKKNFSSLKTLFLARLLLISVTAFQLYEKRAFESNKRKTYT